MKRLVKILLVGALSLGSVQAKEIFNLRAQDFEHTIGDNPMNAKYKVGDVIVETNLRKNKEFGTYRSTGDFNIESIQGLTEWTLDFDFTFDFYSYTSTKPRIIKLTSDKGETFLLEFFQDGFNINGKEFKAKIGNTKLLLNIYKTKNNITIKLNNQKLLDEAINFSTLKYINTNIYYCNSSDHDILNQIILVSHD